MDQRQVFLRDILTVLFKRKLLIVSFAVLVFAVVFVGNYAWPPKYESVAEVRLMRSREVGQSDPSLSRTSSASMMRITPEDINSEMALIDSGSVLLEVVNKLKLTEDLPKSGGILPTAFRGVRSVFVSLQYALGLKRRPSPEQEAMDLVEQSLTIRSIKDSHVLEISCRLGTPEAAHDVLNAVVQAYIKKHLEVFATPKSSEFFREQMERVKGDMIEAQKALDVFRNERKIVSLETERVQLQEQYRDTQRLLVQLEESETVTATTEDTLDDSAIISMLSRQTESTVVTELQLRLLEKMLRRNELVQSKGPRHPDVVGINKEIVAAQKRLREAIETTKTVTERKVREVEDRLKSINELMAEMDTLEREVRVLNDAYEYYALVVEESLVADQLHAQGLSNVKVVSEPSMPVNPVSPRKLFNLALAFIGGIIGGFALAFFLEYLDHGLKTPEDVEAYLGVPPVASFWKTPYEQLDPREAQRLFTMLDLVNAEEPLQLLQVASSVPGEGAHRVARAVAESIAENPDTRALLVDFVGDGIQETPSATGIMDVLTGEVTIDGVLSHMGNLSVVGRGSAECPAYLWNSERMRSLIEELRQRYDRIVFHVAPVLASHDALNLAHIADGVVLVVKADSTRREVAARAIGMLRESKGEVFGVVLVERKAVIPAVVYSRI
jgi:uncharacterized protein involved in exopolysaccharide biosynthesis/Mrp family chromosome partitioning ATPase